LHVYLYPVNANLTSIESDYLIRFREGDSQAFTYFFDRYWEELYRRAFQHVQDEELAKDVVQEVFIHLWERKHLINTDYSSLKPYLWKAVKNKILNYYASEKVRKQVWEQVAQRMDLFIDEGQYSPRDYERLEQLVDKSVSALPPLVKAVYLMRNDNHSITQIAQALNIAEQTVKNYLTEARRRLKQDLNQSFTENSLVMLFLSSAYIVHDLLT